MKKMVHHFHLKYCQAPVLNHFFSAIYSFFDSKAIFFFFFAKYPTQNLLGNYLSYKAEAPLIYTDESSL